MSNPPGSNLSHRTQLLWCSESALGLGKRSNLATFLACEKLSLESDPYWALLEFLCYVYSAKYQGSVCCL